MATANGIFMEDILSILLVFSLPLVVYTIFHGPQFWRYLFYPSALRLGSMIAFLSQYSDFSTPLIAGLRAIAVIVGIAATFFAPPIIRWIGPIRSGIWFLSWQVVFLSPVLITIFLPLSRTLQGGLLVGFVSISRLGLWGFDLSEQYLVQQAFPHKFRGLIVGN